MGPHRGDLIAWSPKRSVRPVHAQRPGAPIGIQRAPLTVEQGKVELIAPAVLEPPIFNLVRLLAHSKASCESRRGLVLAVHTRNNPTQLQLVEAKMQHGVDRFGGIATATVIGMKHVTDLTGPVELGAEE